MNLSDILRERGKEHLFILGTAKNAGKTFSLNRIVTMCHARGETLGLTSTGRDGEAIDLVTGKAKPRVFCPEGTIVATAAAALMVGTAELHEIEGTGIETALGEVRIARVAREGNVELVGPVYAREFGLLSRRMTELGADRVLVDGSLDRKAAARVIRHLVLAVGAVVSPNLEEVVARAAAVVNQLTMPAAPPWAADLVRDAGGVGALLREDGLATPLPWRTLLGAGERLRGLLRAEKPWGLYVKGALGEEAFAALLDADPPPSLVLHDASSLFVGDAQWTRYIARGGRCYATHPFELSAVTINPFSPEGWQFPPAEMLRAVAEKLAPVPVFNLATPEHEVHGQ